MSKEQMMPHPAELKETIYSPDSDLCKPGLLIKDMFSSLMGSRELAWRLFVRNLSAKYRQSLLGYFWAFAPIVITTVVFVFLQKRKILNIGQTESDYLPYVMTGMLLWQLFFDACFSPINMVNSSRDMLTKLNISKEALILAGFFEISFDLMIRLIMTVAVYIWIGMKIPSTIVFFPVGILMLVALGLTIGLLLTPLAMLYQDITRGLGIAMRAGFILTPVVYAPPTTWPFSILSYINPVSPLLVTTRQMMTIGTFTQFNSFLIVSGLILPFFFLAWIMYRLAMPHLVERMNA